MKKLWTDFDEISCRGRAWPRDRWFQFWWRSGSPSGSRSPKSEIQVHWIIELPNQRILITFYGELGCGLETNWLHFGDDPLHYPDPGVRSGSRSGSGKNWRSAEPRRSVLSEYFYSCCCYCYCSACSFSSSSCSCSSYCYYWAMRVIVVCAEKTDQICMPSSDLCRASSTAMLMAVSAVLRETQYAR